MILVIGSTGTVGRCVCRELERLGVAFRALTRDATRAAPRLPAGTDLVEADLGNDRQLRETLANVDAVFMATPANRHVLEWQCTVIDASHAMGVRKIVKLSGPHMGGAVTARLSRLHAQVEAHLGRSGLDYCVLRASPFMQNILRHAATVRKDGMFYAAIGDGEIGFVDARDVARLAVRCLRDRRLTREVVEVTGSSVVSGYEVARRLTLVTRRPIEYVPVPAERLRQIMGRTVRDDWLVDATVELSLAYSKNRGRFVTDDYKRIMGAEAVHMSQFIRHSQTAFI